MFDKLFTPITIKDMTLRNRIIMPAMGTRFTEDRFVNNKHIAYHVARARGGSALNIVEVSSVHALSAPKMFLSIAEDKYIPKLKELTDAIHAEGGKAGIQLWQGGLAVGMDQTAMILLSSDTELAPGFTVPGISKEMIANGGWFTPEVANVGKPVTNDLDGPAGINSLVSSLKGVSFPSEVIVGSSWNTDLAQRFGTAFGAEAAANHVVGLYAPGMNIHRTPFSGRNFEYYSEDGLLSGKMGAAMVQGVDSQGVYTYIKHFALNDQESNRLSLSVWANEQSIREIYLKPFELSVKEGGTTAVMSSYSRLGNTWAGASKALLTDVLRNEWGFHGMVVTDSAMGNTNWMDVNLALRAGGDMMLCLMGVKVDSSTNTAQQAMRRACHNILYTQANSMAIAAAVDNTPYWLILLAIVDSILLIAIVLLLLKRIPDDKKPGKGAKVSICVGIAAVVALVFWAMFFRSGSAPAAAASSESAAAAEPAESTAAPAEEEAKDGVFMELSQTDAGGWLGCHIYLMEDGTFSVTYDYTADNTGIEAAKGTYADNGDGTLTLTADSGDEITVTVTDNGDGTKTYAAEMTEANTAIVCNPTGKH